VASSSASIGNPTFRQPRASSKGKWPDFDFILVSVNSAFIEREENDPTGCTTWGVSTDPTDGYPEVI